MYNKKEREYDNMMGVGSGLQLKNSMIECFNCIFAYSPDTRVADCAIYNLKPSEVLDGGPCSHKETVIDLK